MAQIKMNLEGLRQNSAALSSLIVKIEQDQARLNSLMVVIGESWEGAASKAFISKVQKDIVASGKLLSVLKEYKNYVEQAIQFFDENDKRSAQKIRNSF